MTPIRVKVGCALASGWDKPFASIEQRSRQAARRADQSLSGLGKGWKGENWSRQHIAAEKRATRATQSEAKQRLNAIRREMRERNREHRELLREVEREERKAARQQERIAREKARKQLQIERRSERERESFARRTSHRATRFFWPNAPVVSMAKRGAMDLARGMGVETTFGGALSRVVESDKAARELSVKGFIEGAPGAAGKRVDPRQLREEARALGEEMSMSTEEILRGQSAFVDLRGNLAGARDIARDMAKISRSQGANYRDVMYMAGKAEAMFAGQAEYANDEFKRRKAINSLLKTAVYEAKKYSIPVAEMAKEFPKLAGIASQFEGDAGKNAVLLMGTAQLAEAGAAKNPATASTYAQNLSMALTDKASQFKDIAGVDVFSNKERNKLKGLDEILTQTLLATEQTRKVKVRGRGNVEMNQLQQLKAIMPNKRAYLALQKYQEIFTEAGGGQKGATAVRNALADLANGIKDSQIDKDLEVVLGGTEAKAQKFNQQLERVVSSMADKLIPAFERMEPTILKAVDGFGSMVAWLADNPGLAVSGAISGSIARAGLESTFRTSIERAIIGNMGAGKTNGVAPGGGLLGGATAALTITATAVTLYAAGRVVIDQAMERVGQGQSQSIVESTQTDVRLGTIRRLQREGKYGTKQRDELENMREQLRVRIESAQERGTFAGDWKAVKGWFGMEGGLTDTQIQKRKEDAGKIDELKSQMARVEEALRGRIQVVVANPEDIKQTAPPGTNESGRDNQ